MNGKSLKAITALRDMWSKVNIGWWNADTKEMIDYDQDLEEEHGELNVVKRHITEEEAEAITPDQIMAAFNAVCHRLSLIVLVKALTELSPRQATNQQLASSTSIYSASAMTSRSMVNLLPENTTMKPNL